MTDNIELGLFMLVSIIPS